MKTSIVRLQNEQIFAQYLDPHKEIVAEWGSFCGLYGRDKAPALARVRTLARLAVARAGFGTPTRLDQARQRVNELEKVRSGLYGRLTAAFARLTADQSYASRRIYRKIIRGGVDMATVMFVPIGLTVLAVPTAAAQRSLRKIEGSEGITGKLMDDAEAMLTIEFELAYEKGDEARQRRAVLAAAPKPQTTNGFENDNDMEDEIHGCC